MYLVIFTRDQVQDMLDAAQLNAGYLFANKENLREQLQMLLRENLMECNSREVDPMKLLYQTIRVERIIIDAYNNHRFGNAVEYNENDNIPEELEWSPLHAEVAAYEAYTTAQPICQPESDEERSPTYSADPAALVEEGANPDMNDSLMVAAHQETTSRKTIKRKSTTEGRKSTGPGTLNYDKLKDAPSAWLDLPRGNLTLAETLAFIPHAIKSFDIMDRFLHNGALSGTFAHMINHYRDMQYGPITNNTIYRMMKGPMAHRAKTDPTYEKWTVAKHTTLSRPAGFDPTSVSVAGFSTPYNFNSRERAVAAAQPPHSIPFRDMANGVKIMPSGHDALDITRCVQHCVENNDPSWLYPQDFENLVAQLGGAATVHRYHHDDAALRRHTSEKKLNNAKRAGARKRDKNGRLMKQPKNSVVDSDEEELFDDESEADQDNFDFDALDIEDDETVNTTKKGSQRKNVSGDDTSDEDGLTPRTRNVSKRKRTSNEDNEEPLPRQKSKRSNKTAPRTPARRSTRTRSSSRFSKEVLPEAVDSGSDSDAYVGPKRKTKKAKVSTRSSTRGQRFGGSYDFEHTQDGEDQENEDEDESEVEQTPLRTGGSLLRRRCVWRAAREMWM